jgi:hypothetical protein
MTPSARRAACGLISAFALALVACTDEATSGALSRELQAIEGFTIPPAANNVERASPETPGRTVAQRTWRFATDLTWDAYRQWVMGQLPNSARFQLKNETAQTLEFSKQVPGDFYHVEIRREADGPPVQIQVNFVGMPD